MRMKFILALATVFATFVAPTLATAEPGQPPQTNAQDPKAKKKKPGEASKPQPNQAVLKAQENAAARKAAADAAALKAKAAADAQAKKAQANAAALKAKAQADAQAKKAQADAQAKKAIADAKAKKAQADAAAATATKKAQADAKAKKAQADAAAAAAAKKAQADAAAAAKAKAAADAKAKAAATNAKPKVPPPTVGANEKTPPVVTNTKDKGPPQGGGKPGPDNKPDVKNAKDTTPGDNKPVGDLTQPRTKAPIGFGGNTPGASAAATKPDNKKPRRDFKRVKEPRPPVLTKLPTDDAGRKRLLIKERAKSDVEFERARRDAERRGKSNDRNIPRFDQKAETRFIDVRKSRKERVGKGGLALIEEGDDRFIVRESNRVFIRHDDDRRMGRFYRDTRRERRSDGTTVIINVSTGGSQIETIEDEHGHVLRRIRRYPDGREVVFYDNRPFYRRHSTALMFGALAAAVIALPPPVVEIPREKYVVEYDDASDEDIYEALSAPPVEPLQRRYSLEEVRSSYTVRERMRRVDLDTITFAFASWDVEPDQYAILERIANAMKRIIENNPDEVWLIEGHTDAVGSAIDNLSLSDRRAESVSLILTEQFGIPPENMTTQGYGEEQLKEDTTGPSEINRRVSIRRITPLLSRTEKDD